MKYIFRFYICLNMFLISDAVICAQTIDKSKIAYELFEYSVFTINESLPQDLGNMVFERISITENSCDYYYTIKDNADFIENRDNISQVKKNLYMSFDQNLASMESTLMFCIDADISIKYHYRNRYGSEFVVPFSVSEFKDILDRDYITNSYRQEVLKRWLPIAFLAAAGSPMSYQGMTERSIMYTLITDGEFWVDNIKMDQAYMIDLLKEEFENNEPGRFFSLLCIYAEKGEDLTVVNEKTGARHNGMISYSALCDVYKSTHHENGPFSIGDASISYGGGNYDEESIPFQLVDIKPLFNGGTANAFSEWVNTQLVYPEQAREHGIQGRVILQFTVDANGYVKNVRVLRGVDPLLDEEAVRVVKKSPKWTSGRQDGRAVSVTYTFPVIFVLN
jgi:outer membrane transport energization protein TonB (TC 2.C.1.1.1)